MGPLTRAVLLDAEETSTVVAQKYLDDSFAFPHDWVYIHFNSLAPHRSLEKARVNIEAVMTELYSTPEAMAELTVTLQALKKFELRCNSFYRDLEELMALCDQILKAKALDKAQEEWLKGQLKQFQKAFELLVELDDPSTIRRKSYLAVTKLKDRLNGYLAGIDYLAMPEKLKALEEPILNMEIDLLMAENLS